MLARVFSVVVLALSVFSLNSVQATGLTAQCSLYARANTAQPNCNERYTCSGKCTGPFITAKHCLLIRHDTDGFGKPNVGAPPNKAVPQVLCNVGYGRNTAAAKTCITTTASYSCDKGVVADTQPTCYNCVVPKV